MGVGRWRGVGCFATADALFHSRTYTVQTTLRSHPACHLPHWARGDLVLILQDNPRCYPRCHSARWIESPLHRVEAKSRRQREGTPAFIWDNHAASRFETHGPDRYRGTIDPRPNQNSSSILAPASLKTPGPTTMPPSERLFTVGCLCYSGNST